MLRPRGGLKAVEVKTHSSLLLLSRLGVVMQRGWWDQGRWEPGEGRWMGSWEGGQEGEGWGVGQARSGRESMLEFGGEFFVADWRFGKEKIWKMKNRMGILSPFIESVSTIPQLTSTYCKPCVPCETTG